MWDRRAGRRNGKGKVMDKRLENGIGHPHACQNFLKSGPICKGWGRVE